MAMDGRRSWMLEPTCHAGCGDLQGSQGPGTPVWGHGHVQWQWWAGGPRPAARAPINARLARTLELAKPPAAALSLSPQAFVLLHGIGICRLDRTSVAKQLIGLYWGLEKGICSVQSA